MCIALISTAHPDYALILIDNRDEFLSRPTAPAAWWEAPSSHVLGGRDLLRAARGTWLGITTDGRIAVLTNFREEGPANQSLVSRGAMVNAYLTQRPENALDTETFVKKLVEDGQAGGSGGFTLVCGRVGEALAVFSNRTPTVDGVSWIAKERGETIGLSNAAFGDRSWPKVLRGEQLMLEKIEQSFRDGDDQNQLIEKLMDLLSENTLPAPDNMDWETFTTELRKSIFIPIIGNKAPASDAEPSGGESALLSEKVEASNTPTSGAYGTQEQTVVLVDHDHNVTFVERTLYEGFAVARSSLEAKDRKFVFQIVKPS